ncbi:MAG TPA: ABC transporter ATP-binding protein [Alphaproteobacteria bacterium]
MTDAPISIRGVRKVFTDAGGSPDVVALEQIDLEIPARSFVSFLGPSGCGKTTLLRMIAGIEQPSAGQIVCKGHAVDRVNTDVAYVPQGRGLFPWMTLCQNIEFPLRVRGVAAAERAKRARAWITKVGLEGFEDSHPWQLSGGMEKRGALARALIGDLDILLMDEPFGPLDAQTRLVLQDDLLRLWSEKRSIAVFVTHDLVEAVALSDLVVIMSRRPGRIKKIVPVNIPRPRNVFEIFHADGFNAAYDEVRETLRGELALVA